jgi:hypothetical protein
MGLRQLPSETLRWVSDHPDSSYGLGAILRGKSGQSLSGRAFATMVENFGAWIETDSERTARRVRNALATFLTETSESVIVAPAKGEKCPRR